MIVYGVRSVILNRGPHGPPGGNLQVLGGGGNTEHLGNWGGMDPFGGNQQIAINSPGCSSGWRIVAASAVIVDVTLWPEGSSALDTGHFGHSAQTKMDTGPMKQARIQVFFWGGGGCPTAVCNIFFIFKPTDVNFPLPFQFHCRILST